MNIGWRNSSASKRHVPPVEMRFVDMFMAALGALIFMAMLMAFLLRFYPAHDVPSTIPLNGNNYRIATFEVATRILPPARVGELYEMSFAFRGGLPPVIWEVTAGEADLPSGILFDPAKGVLSGLPQGEGQARFTIRARDQNGAAETRPYELAVLPPLKTTRKVENGLAITMLIVVFLLWLIFLSTSADMRRKLAMLRQAQAEGKTGVEIETGRGTREIIEFDKDGIETVEGGLRTSQAITRFVFIVLLILAAWLAWRLWKG